MTDQARPYEIVDFAALPGVRHRAIGTLRVLIVALPMFHPTDEWFH